LEVINNLVTFNSPNKNNQIVCFSVFFGHYRWENRNAIKVTNRIVVVEMFTHNLMKLYTDYTGKFQMYIPVEWGYDVVF